MKQLLFEIYIALRSTYNKEEATIIKDNNSGNHTPNNNHKKISIPEIIGSCLGYIISFIIIMAGIAFFIWIIKDVLEW